jgi:signal peptidase
MGKRLHAIKLTATLLFAGLGLVVAAVSLPFTGLRALSVQTGSMKPAIDPGALVLVRSVSPDSLKRGDVITYKSKVNPGTTTTHRIVERSGLPDGPKTTITKGDANKIADAPVYDPQIVGKVVGSVPLAGKALDFIKTPVGLATVIYLPIVLIFVSEIRLLVRRLTELELIKQRGNLQPLTASGPAGSGLPNAPADDSGAARAAAGAHPDATTHQPTPAQPVASPSATRHKKPPRRLIGGMGLLLAVAGSGALLMPTFATLEAEASLSGNVISTAEPETPPEDFAARVLIDRVSFGHTIQGRWNNKGPITWYTEPAVIKLYANTQYATLNTRGWTLESNMGVVYRFPSAKWNGWDSRVQEVTLGRYTSPRTAGDFMVIKDRRGRVVDSLSWGTNTTQFSPALPAVRGGDQLERVFHVDTDTAADWRKVTHSRS